MLCEYCLGLKKHDRGCPYGLGAARDSTVMFTAGWKDARLGKGQNPMKMDNPSYMLGFRKATACQVVTSFDRALIEQGVQFHYF
jgi:hypothetical protein